MMLRASSSLPALADNPTQWCEAEAEVRRLGERLMLALPFAAPVGSLRGRRYRVAIGEGRPHLRVVFNVGGQAVIRLDEGEAADGDVLKVRIQALPSHRGRGMPPDLTRALHGRGLTVEVLPGHEIEQLLLMVAESSSPQIRVSRIEAGVRAVAARTAALREEPRA